MNVNNTDAGQTKLKLAHFGKGNVTAAQLTATFRAAAPENKETHRSLHHKHVQVTTWLVQSCLQPNTTKTVSMFFTKRSTSTPDPDIIVSGKKTTD